MNQCLWLRPKGRGGLGILILHHNTEIQTEIDTAMSGISLKLIVEIECDHVEHKFSCELW